jgi:hypothetical protein
VPYGEARCAQRGTGVGAMEPAPAAARVTVRARPEGGEPREASLTVPAAEPTLARMLAAECTAQALAATVDVAFGDAWSAGVDGRLHGTIELTLLDSTSAVALTAVRGSVLFALTPSRASGEPLLTVDISTPTAALPVTVSLGRCDAHALAEAKQGYLFKVWLSVDSDEEQFLALSPDEASRQLMEDMLRHCVPPTR